MHASMAWEPFKELFFQILLYLRSELGPEHMYEFIFKKR